MGSGSIFFFLKNAVLGLSSPVKASKTNIYFVAFFVFSREQLSRLSICEICLIVTAANREAITHVTYVWCCSEVNSTAYCEFEQPIRTCEKHYPLF